MVEAMKHHDTSAFQTDRLTSQSHFPPPPPTLRYSMLIDGLDGSSAVSGALGVMIPTISSWTTTE